MVVQELNFKIFCTTVPVILHFTISKVNWSLYYSFVGPYRLQVQLSYLMVGHTHEDINQVILKFFNMLFHSMPPLEGIYQLLCTIDFTFYIKMFSRISVALARTNAVMLDDLIHVIREHTTLPPSHVQLKTYTT